jgi:hypothetical protein
MDYEAFLGDQLTRLVCALTFGPQALHPSQPLSHMGLLHGPYYLQTSGSWCVAHLTSSMGTWASINALHVRSPPNPSDHDC